MLEIRPDNAPFKIFLAGSIEMGAAEEWQKEVVKAFSSYEDVIIYNPRRHDWDTSWKQEMGDNQFTKQVEWELKHLDDADVILMYFDPATKSPISLLELGLYANKRKLVVVCPEGFYRKGNVDITCRKYGITVYTTLDIAIQNLKIKEYRHTAGY